MALPSTITPSNDYVIVQENTTTGIVVSSGGSIGEVVAAPISGEVGEGQQIMYLNAGAIQFSKSGQSFQVIPIKNILLTYTPPVVS